MIQFVAAAVARGKTRDVPRPYQWWAEEVGVQNRMGGRREAMVARNVPRPYQWRAEEGGLQNRRRELFMLGLVMHGAHLGVARFVALPRA